MRNSFRDLVQQDELDRVARERGGGRVFHPNQPTHQNRELLDRLTEHEEENGWTVERRFRTTTRMSRPKSADVQLEDDVWSLFHRMRFTAMNRDRNFVVAATGDENERQIDVVARDENVIYMVECTHKVSPGRRSVTNLIQRFAHLRNEIRSQIDAAFEDGRSLQLKFLIATRGIEWSDNDRARARSEGIGIMREDDLRYFGDLTRLLRDSAKYQFNARYFAGKANPAIERKVFASRIRIGERRALHFMASPYDILRIASVSHRARTSENDLKSYQRMVDSKRLEDIGGFIREGNSFPTNIVCNFRIGSHPLRFDPKDRGERSGDVEYGLLTLPPYYGCLMVIDGQHRLYGYAYCERDFPGRDRAAVSILAYEGLSIEEETRIFVDINTKQKKVSAGLASEIQASIGLEQEDPRDRLMAVCTHVAQRLDSDAASPLRGTIKSEFDKGASGRILTLTNVSEGLRKHNLVGAASKSGKSFRFKPGPLSVGVDDAERNVGKALEVMIGVMELTKTGAPTNWDLRDGAGGFWLTNTGYRTMVRLLASVLAHLDERGLRAEAKTAGEVVAAVTPHVRYAATFIEKGGSERVESFRSRSSAGGIDINAEQLEMALCEFGGVDYAPKPIVDKIAGRDHEGTADARLVVETSTRLLLSTVARNLRSLFPNEDDWWFQGVPAEIQSTCARAVTRDRGRSSPWDHVGLPEALEIIGKTGNWRSFKTLIGTRPGRSGRREDVLREMLDIVPLVDELRNPDTVLSRTQVAEIREFSRLVATMDEALTAEIGAMEPQEAAVSSTRLEATA